MHLSNLILSTCFISSHIHRLSHVIQSENTLHEICNNEPFTEKHERRVASFEFHTAPMQCYTSYPLRKLYTLLSPSSIIWTEMEKVDDLFPRHMEDDLALDFLMKSLEKRLGHETNYREINKDPKLVLQFGSNNPERLRKCVKYTVAKYHGSLREINLNCGCPSIESGGATTYGASLMKEVQLTSDLVRAARKGIIEGLNLKENSDELQLPIGVSVKTRIAVFEHIDDMVDLDDDHYNYLQKYVTNIVDAGANHIILHARPAILSGLSPVKNRIVPNLNYDFVKRVQTDFGENITVTLNGGIKSIHHLKKQISMNGDENDDKSRIYSIMAGRYPLERPLDLVAIEKLFPNDASSNYFDIYENTKKALEKYLDFSVSIQSTKQPTYTIAELCLPIFLIVEQLRDDYNNEEEEDYTNKPLLSYAEIEDLYDIIVEGISSLENLCKKGKAKKKPKIDQNEINFKRLSTSFKSLVGTKVVNKWKRNRTEL